MTARQHQAQQTADQAIGPVRPLAGRHAIVTGGGRGIGLAIARHLAGLGADLTLTGRDEARLAGAARDLATDTGVRIVTAVADLADGPAFATALDEATDRLGAPAILVNNAGAAGSQPFHRMTDAHWAEMIEVNLTGAFRACRAVVPAMLAAGFGRIVNVASTAGLRGYGYVAAYVAAKHGVVGLTRALALEYAGRGITANAVCPGYADTDMTRATIANIVAKTGRSEAEALAELVRDNPQRRLIQPDEVAEAVGWFCLPAAASITGQVIAVAGGEVMP